MTGNFTEERLEPIRRDLVEWIPDPANVSWPWADGRTWAANGSRHVDVQPVPRLVEHRVEINSSDDDADY